MKKIMLIIICVMSAVLTQSDKAEEPVIAVVSPQVIASVSPAGQADLAEAQETSEMPPDDIPAVLVEKEISITLSFLGDCMLATSKGGMYEGSFNYMAQNMPPEYFFEGVIDIIGEDDFTIADCENVFTDRPLYELEKGYYPAYWFKGPSKNAEIFSSNSIELVSLANNHTYDYGIEGYNDTVSAVEKAGVEWTDEAKPVILEKDGVKIAVLSLILYRYGTYDATFSQIEEYKDKVDAVVVVFHGGTEKVHVPDEFKVKAARAFIDAGANVVVGGHPHVLQPFEEYNGGHIVYSIGNFCYGGSGGPENRTIIYQETLTFDKDGKLIGMNENIIPCYVYSGQTNNYQPAVIYDEEIKNKVLDFMYQRSSTLF